MLPVAPLTVLGKTSVKPIPLRGLELFGLVTVKVSDVVLSGALVKIEVGEKDLLRAGGAMTVNVSSAYRVVGVPPMDKNPLTLSYRPSVVPVTLTVMAQLLF